MSPVQLALVAVFAPAAAAVLLLILFPLRHRGAPAAWVCILGSLAALGAAAKLLVDRIGGASVARETIPWILERGRPMAEVGVQLDGVSLPMLVVVCVVALCVQLFSVAYMHDEPAAGVRPVLRAPRDVPLSMNVLVIAPNLLQAFAGWSWSASPATC